MQNFDELAEGYLGLVEKQKVGEGKAVNSFTRGDMHELELITNRMGLEWMQRTPTVAVGKRTKVSYNVTNYAEDGIVVLFCDIVKD